MFVKVYKRSVLTRIYVCVSLLNPPNVLFSLFVHLESAKWVHYPFFFLLKLNELRHMWVVWKFINRLKRVYNSLKIYKQIKAGLQYQNPIGCGFQLVWKQTHLNLKRLTDEENLKLKKERKGIENSRCHRKEGERAKSSTTGDDALRRRYLCIFVKFMITKIINHA